MTTTMFAAAMIWSIAAPGPKEPPKKAAPTPAIVGEWICESITVRGQKAPSPGLAIVFTADGKVFKEFDGKTEPGEQTYSVNEKKSPAHIDWTFRKNEGKVLGIWKVKGNTLTLCIVDGYDGLRPSEFQSRAGTKEMLFTLKRAPKKK